MPAVSCVSVCRVLWPHQIDGVILLECLVKPTLRLPLNVYSIYTTFLLITANDSCGRRTFRSDLLVLRANNKRPTRPIVSSVRLNNGSLADCRLPSSGERWRARSLEGKRVVRVGVWGIAFRQE